MESIHNSCRVWLLLIVIFFIFFQKNHSVAEKTVSIAYVGFSTDKPFWVALGDSIKSEAESRRINLVDLTPTDPDSLAQVMLVEHAVNKKVDVIIVGASIPQPFTDALSKAQKANIPVIAVDTRLDHPAVKAFVATDNDKGARLAGEYIVAQTKGKGSLLILGGTKNHPNGDARKDGVSLVARESGMPVIFRYADWDDEKAYKITLEVLRDNSNISAIFSCWDPGIDTASHALERINYAGKPVMVGFDGLPRTVRYVKEGRVTATIAQDTNHMGKKSIEIALKIINNQTYPQITLIPPYVIDADNVANF